MHCKLAYYYVFWPRPRDMLEVAAWCIFILEEGSLNSKEEVTGPRNANIVSRRMFNIAPWSPALLIFIVFETRLREVLLAALHSAATLPMKLTNFLISRYLTLQLNWWSHQLCSSARTKVSSLFPFQIFSCLVSTKYVWHKYNPLQKDQFPTKLGWQLTSFVKKCWQIPKVIVEGN